MMLHFPNSNKLNNLLIHKLDGSFDQSDKLRFTIDHTGVKCEWFRHLARVDLGELER